LTQPTSRFRIPHIARSSQHNTFPSLAGPLNTLLELIPQAQQPVANDTELAICLCPSHPTLPGVRKRFQVHLLCLRWHPPEPLEYFAALAYIIPLHRLTAPGLTGKKFGGDKQPKCLASDPPARYTSMCALANNFRPWETRRCTLMCIGIFS